MSSEGITKCKKSKFQPTFYVIEVWFLFWNNDGKWNNKKNKQVLTLFILIMHIIMHIIFRRHKVTFYY